MRYNSTLQEKAIEAAQKALYGIDRFGFVKLYKTGRRS